MSFDVRAIRREFPILAQPIDGRPLHYLDNAATGQAPRTMIEAIVAFETLRRANVLRGVHHLAEAATEAYADARAAVARYINAAPQDLVFTSGTTASINLVARAFGDGLAAGDEVVISVAEHHSNIVPWQMLRQRRGIVLKALQVDDEGRLDLAAIERTVTAKCRLIAVTHVSNVTGAVTDVARIVSAARAVGARVLLDGAQRAPHGPIDVPALGVDFYAFSGHKMFGPNGVGALWGQRELLEAMPPFLGGGEMIRTVTLERTEYAAPPHKFEAGTPPIAQAIGLGATVRWLMTLDWPAISDHEMRLAQRTLDGLSGIRGARVLGPGGLQARAPVVSFALDGAHPHDVCQILDGRGVALRGGHHCAQPLMDRFGLAGTTRASLALYNNDADVDALLSGLDEAARRLR
ncbi:MAG TPA: SufS family cysteine desulfurase [Alphaproteobacteria bacterium]|jgi:cysteine desulfurase/selenocysteine lyase|nr:SufS family cysteine desulfurase [Alphaproteobacteria bacterium]